MTRRSLSRSTCPPSRRGRAAPATTPWRSPPAWSPGDDVALTLISRRDDETRWTELAPGGPGPRRGSDGAPGPARVRAGGPAVLAALLGPRRPSRAALHHAEPGASAVRGDDPRLHILRSSRVARADQGRLLPARHPARRAEGGRADLREPGNGRTAARLVPRAGARSSWRTTGSTMNGSGLPNRCPVLIARRSRAAGVPLRSPARRLRRHPRTPQGGRPTDRCLRPPRRARERRRTRPGRPAGLGPRGDRARAGLGPPRRSHRAHRLSARRHGAGAPARRLPSPPARPSRRGSACPPSRPWPAAHPS